ncbi:MAG: hypothetical protein HY906_19175 [Deltaproteobacteria bacterium]|nr:hypothetical protein [Deltaproteobacteria bacterium]
MRFHTRHVLGLLHGLLLPLVASCTGAADEELSPGQVGVLRQAVAGEWQPAASMPVGRYVHTATLLQNGKVLVAGGSTASFTALASALLYDPAANSWSPAGTMPQARTNHTATLLPSGKVLVVGGTPDGLTALASASLYDPAANSWSPAASMPQPRADHTATLLEDGTVLVAGGSPDGEYTVLAAALRYSPAGNSWTATGSMAQGRSYHAALRLPSGKVLVSGGLGTGFAPLASATTYDPTTGTWSPAGTLSQARGTHDMALLGTGEVLAAGGTIYSTTWLGLTNADLYNPTSNSWQAVGSLAQGRRSHTLTVLQSGAVLATGGWHDDGTTAWAPVAASELYDPPTRTWNTTGPLAQGRGWHTATRLGTGMVLAAGGGYDNQGVFVVLASAELYESLDCAILGVGAPCGLCRVCDASLTCTGTPADDPACGTLDCSGLNGACRTYGALTSNRCASFGACKQPGVATCTEYTDAPFGTQCVLGYCADTTLQRPHACGTGPTAGECVEGGEQDCTPFSCDSGALACRTSCDQFAPCAPTAYCDVGTCRPQKAAGAPCVGAGQCLSGFCVDGVCCNTACTGRCASCSLERAVGTCAPIPAGEDPDAECASAGSCGGTCDGAGGCVPASPGEPCGTCKVCNASGQCAAVPDGTSCEGTLFCVTGETCQAGRCQGGTARDCGDDDPCTADACSEAAKRCLNERLADGAACDDGNACTTGTVCFGGACSGGSAVDCDDDDPCTVDSCDPAAGCGHAASSDPACRRDAGPSPDGGATGDGGADAAPPPQDGGGGVTRQSGCSCVTGRAPGGPTALAVIAAVGFALARGARRSSRRP